jgi:hypothetical protein
MWLYVFSSQYVKDNKIFTDIWMVITHFEDVDFSQSGPHHHLIENYLVLAMI